MEVKVGQVWKSKYGSYYKILDVKDKTVVVEIDGEDVAVIFKKYLTDAKLVSESDPSDLEIVQKALIKVDGQLVWTDPYVSVISSSKVLVDGSIEDVLTWAKQTIGVL